MCVRKAWYQKKQTENQPVVRNSWAVIPCKFGVYHTCEYEMLSLKIPSSFAFSATGASVKWCVCKSVLADTFKRSIYMVQTGAELNLLPVSQHQGILWCQTGQPRSPIAGKQKPRFSHLQAGAKCPHTRHFLALCECRVGRGDPLSPLWNRRPHKCLWPGSRETIQLLKCCMWVFVTLVL